MSRIDSLALVRRPTRAVGRRAGPGRVRQGTIAAAVVVSIALFAACQDAPSVTGPNLTVQAFGGIEQELQLKTDNPWDPSGRWFHLSSRLVNRGDQPVVVRVRTCELRLGIDLISTPRADFVGIGQPGCVEEPDLVTLAPGDSSNVVSFTGMIRERGQYRIAVRHAVDPELWGSIDVFAR